MQRTLLALICLLATCFSGVNAADAHYEAADGWPTPLGWTEYGGSLQRTGRSPAEGPDAARDAAPSVPLGARSFSAPVLDRAGHVYVGDLAGKVHRFTPDLKKVWSSPALGGPIRSSVLVSPDGTVYAAPVGKDLVAIDASSGKALWRAAIGNTAPEGEYVITGAPAWHPDGFVVQGSMDGSVYAIDAEGGQKWRFRTEAQVDNKVVATAAIARDGTIYIGSQNGRLYALDAAGNEQWSFRTTRLTSGLCPEEQQVAAPSIADDGTLYIGTRLKGCGSAGMVYALRDDGTRPTLLWTRNVADKITAPVTVGAGEHVYVGALDGTFYALSADDGTIAWSFRPQDDDPTLREAIGVSVSLSAAELAVVDAAGVLFVPYWNVDLSKGFPPQDSLRSPFYALGPDGEIMWRKVFPNAIRSAALMPTINDSGILYLAGDDGRLYALGTSKPVPPEVPPGLEPPLPVDLQTPYANEGARDQDEAPAPAAVALLVVVALAAMARRRA